MWLLIIGVSAILAYAGGYYTGRPFKSVSYGRKRVTLLSLIFAGVSVSSLVVMITVGPVGALYTLTCLSVIWLILLAFNAGVYRKTVRLME